MHYICSFKQYSFSLRLKVLWLVISWSGVGIELHAAEPANAKLRSPNLRRVAGWSRERHAVLDCIQKARVSI